MRAKTIFRNAMPRLYSRLARGRKILRLLAKMRNGDFDLGLIIDVIEKSRGMYSAECLLCGFIGRFKSFGSPPRWNALCPNCGSL
jgi:hypothetical protein